MTLLRKLSRATILVRSGEEIYNAVREAPEGAVIQLAAGRWHEGPPVGLITKSLTLRGKGAARTVIQAGIQRPVVLVRAEGTKPVHVVLEGLTVLTRHPIGGAGVRVEGSAQVTLRHCILSDNDAGIELRDSAQGTIVNTNIFANRGGVSVLDGASATITRCRIFENEFDGICIAGCGQAAITNCSICQNGVTGVYAKGNSRVKIGRCRVSRNEQAGICLEHSAEATIEGNRIKSNGGYGVLAGGTYTFRDVAGKLLCQIHPCFEAFRGYVAGKGNTIRGHLSHNVSPTDLAFLVSVTVGDLDRRGLCPSNGDASKD